MGRVGKFVYFIYSSKVSFDVILYLEPVKRFVWQNVYPGWVEYINTFPLEIGRGRGGLKIIHSTPSKPQVY